MANKNVQTTVHIDLNTFEEAELFQKLKGKVYARGKTVRQWMLEKMREEVYPLSE